MREMGDGGTKRNFLFSNPQVIVRRKQQMLWHTIQDAPLSQQQQQKRKKRKKPCPDKVKANSEPHRMASTMAPTP